MIVYHGTTPQFAQQFMLTGIDAHLPYPRQNHGPQDNVPGIYVTPKISVARRFGLCVLAIEIPKNELLIPPNLVSSATGLEEVLSAKFEPQAFISSRIEPTAIHVAECHATGYPFNPYEKDD